MKLTTPHIEHLIERSSTTNGLHSLAEAAARELEDIKLTALDRNEMQLHGLRQAAEGPLHDLEHVRPEVEAVPAPEVLDSATAYPVFSAIRALRRIDEVAAALEGPDALSFRYELRAATAWLQFAQMPHLTTTHPEDAHG